ncbi:MAG: methyltransferase type 11 [Actinomycetia bacterium]|nr:methyltransferase type 11 [Actinomycetes bacterium]
MHTVVNIEQAQAWNGYEGEHWAEHHDRWNAVNSGFNGPLLAAAAIADGDRVLDVGCGAGQTTRLAARTAGRGAVVGFDLSAPMLERARALAVDEGIANVTFEQGDAQVHPFPGGGFDVAISRFGIMFFADPVAAFANIGRALRPGGRLAFVSMAEPRRNDWIQVSEAMRQHVTMPDFQVGAGMFSLADPERIDEVLTGAGLAEVTSTPVESPMNWGRDAGDAADLLTGSGPARFMLSQVDRATAGRARDAVTAALRAYEEPGGVVLRGAAWVVTATRPSVDE